MARIPDLIPWLHKLKRINTQVISCWFICFLSDYFSEPLAKSLSRNYQLPDRINDPNFTYGNETDFNDYVAKDVIAPNDV